MGNFVSGTTGSPIGHTAGEPVSTFISQVEIGGTLYDIATHHGITFRDGTTGDKIEWNGLTDLDVIIPNISDLVANPIVYAGNFEIKDGSFGFEASDGFNKTPQTGYMAFVLANGEIGGATVEPGDMAVFDGKDWKIVTGENQIEISGIGTESSKTFTIGETATSVLDVEGRSLLLAVNYADARPYLKVTSADKSSVALSNGTVTVSSVGLSLSKAADTTKTIASSITLNIPTKLASTAVSFTGPTVVLSKGDFSFDGGTKTSATINSTSMAVDVNNTQTLISNATAGIGFVASITGAVKDVKVNDSTTFTAVSGIASKTGASFVQGIVAQLSTETDKGVFETTKYALGGQQTFATDFGTPASSGDVVSSITVGGVSVATKPSSKFVTGISGATGVITAVSFGTVSSNGSSWFITGLDASAATKEVITSVTYTSGKIDTQAGTFATAFSVESGVLKLTTGTALTKATLTGGSITCTSAGFKKGGVTYGGYSATSNTLTTASALTDVTLTQAATAVSYKSLTKGTVTLTPTVTSYKLNTAGVKEYEVQNKTYTIGTSAVSPTMGTLGLSGSVTASIPAGKVITSVAPGNVASLTVGNGQTITATVGDALTTESKTFNVVGDDAKSIAIPGAYTLVSTTDSSAVSVGAAGKLTVSGTVNVGTVVTSVSWSK